MTYQRLTPLVAVAVLLAGCGDKRQAERVVRETLKDPDSARFGEFYYNDKTRKGCLTVNAKNSMGGYTGNRQAYVEKTKDGWEASGMGDISQSTCREIHADVTP